MMERSLILSAILEAARVDTSDELVACIVSARVRCFDPKAYGDGLKPVWMM